MTDMPRFLEPMCGWPHDADICDHNMVRSTCDCSSTSPALKATVQPARKDDS